MPEWMKNKEEAAPTVSPEEIKKIISESQAEQNKKLDAVADYIAKQQQKEEKAEADRIAAANAQANKQRHDRLTDEGNWLTNPGEMTAEMIKPLIEQQQRTNARLAKEDALGRMEYYDDPTFKSAVDQLISSQPINLQSDPALIMNCYKSVFFDKQQEIKDGRIKSQLSLNGGGRGSGGHNGSESSKSNDTMTDAEKHYASKLGISTESWIKNRNEMEYV